MPEAKGNRAGTITSKNELSKTKTLTFIGESPVIGVGVENIEEGLVATTAQHLSKQLACTVHWQAIGVNGINITQTIDTLVNQLANAKPDYLVICLGVNDTKGLTRLSTWETEITRLIDTIQTQCSAEIFLLSTPNMSRFPALPNPLAYLLGYRSRLLNSISCHHPYNGKAFRYIPFNQNFDASYLAKDGFHPSAKGCEEIGRTIAQLLN